MATRPKKKTKKAPVRAKTQAKTKPKRQVIRSKGWKHAPTIDAAKFDQIAKAIFAALKKGPLRFGYLYDAVDARMKTFDGSVGWYTLACLRELETQKKVVRTVEKRAAFYALGRGSKKN